MNRKELKEAILKKQEEIKKVEAELLELVRENYLLSDNTQQYVEEEDDKGNLVGFVKWKQTFVDQDHRDDRSKDVTVDRGIIVKKNGEWI